MEEDKAYLKAEWKIEEAARSGSTVLDLENMGLTELPESVGTLVNLTVLKLGYDSNKAGDLNQLRALPSSLVNLTQLRVLKLYNNQLTSVPEVLGNLTQLHELGLDDNPLEPELAAAYREGVETVKAYLREKSKSARKPN